MQEKGGSPAVCNTSGEHGGVTPRETSWTETDKQRTVSLTCGTLKQTNVQKRVRRARAGAGRGQTRGGGPKGARPAAGAVRSEGLRRSRRHRGLLRAQALRVLIHAEVRRRMSQSAPGGGPHDVQAHQVTARCTLSALQTYMPATPQRS